MRNKSTTMNDVVNTLHYTKQKQKLHSITIKPAKTIHSKLGSKEIKNYIEQVQYKIKANERAVNVSKEAYISANIAAKKAYQAIDASLIFSHYPATQRLTTGGVAFLNQVTLNKVYALLFHIQLVMEKMDKYERILLNPLRDYP